MNKKYMLNYIWFIPIYLTINTFFSLGYHKRPLNEGLVEFIVNEWMSVLLFSSVCIVVYLLIYFTFGKWNNRYVEARIKENKEGEV